MQRACPVFGEARHERLALISVAHRHPLRIEEQPQSRSRHSNDNTLAESGNGCVVRRHLGYAFTTDRNQPPEPTLYPHPSDACLDWNVLRIDSRAE